MGDLACPHCGRSCPERLRRGAFSIRRCGACDLEFVGPTPSQQELDALYARGYFSGGGCGYADYAGVERDRMRRKSVPRLRALRELGAGEGRLLDVGCASGFFLSCARDAGYETVGVDASEEARRAVEPSLRERVVSSLDEAARFGPFDAITAWDVLEHLPAPADTLARLRALAKPAAILGVVCPVLGSATTRWAPSRWDQYKPPEHLWFWSARSLRAELARAGWEVLREEEAWSRPGRWYLDGEGPSAGRALDALAGRVLGALHRPWVVDSMALYARSRR